MSIPGRIALVGSGEFLPVMADFERDLLSRGPSKTYVQLPTAAGRESESRLDYWRAIGAEQAERIGAEQIFLPVFNREDAMRSDLAAQIEGAGLIYLSGGDPHYLAESLLGTPVLDAIYRNWQAGSSIAGCSAGAMAIGPDIPHFRKMKEIGSSGFAFAPSIRTIPHYNKFFGWIPDQAVPLFLKAPAHITVVGIDEETAIWSDDLTLWTVVGKRSAHILSGDSKGEFANGSTFTISK